MGFFIALYRIIRFALQNFWRNIWLSVITVTILVLTLFIVNTLLVLNVLGQTAIKAVESKIDVSVSFVQNADVNVISSAKAYLQSLPQVKDARELSPDEVLAEFKAKNADKPEVLASIDEVGSNPFGAELIVSARDPADFPFILQTLENPQYKSSIQAKDFQSHEEVIGAINSTINQVRLIGIVIGLIFVFITILIVVNTIRVAIYTHREEIGIMRLVGASSAFVRAPFLVEAILYTFVAMGIIAAIFYPLLTAIQPTLDGFFNGTSTNLVGYFVSNAGMIVGVEFGALAFLNVVATAFAMRRYLKV